MVDPALVEQVTSLPIDQQRELLDVLQESVEHGGSAISAETAALVQERMAAIRANPMQGRSWSEVRADLKARHAR